MSEDSNRNTYRNRMHTSANAFAIKHQDDVESSSDEIVEAPCESLERADEVSAIEEPKSDAVMTLMKGATILAIAGIVSKIFGAIFRIPLTNMIGAEGQSYYGAAYPVYQLFYIVATAGFPVAISRMVSERVAKGDYINAHKSYKMALNTTLVVSFVSFLICFFGAGSIAEFVKNPGAEMSIKALSFALLFTPIAASLRGYFQGHQKMVPTAVSEVIEQMVRVCVGLFLSYMFYRTSLEYAAAGATFGASAGIAAAMIVLIIMYRMSANERARDFDRSIIREETGRERFDELLKIVIPITIGSSILPLMNTIDMAVIMRRLQATGWDLGMSKTLYGLISGYCDPLVSLPVVFIEAITIGLIPAITTAFTLKRQDDLNANIKTGLKTMMIITYPCSIGIIVLARPILQMLYPTKVEEAYMATHTLQILAFSIITLATMRTLSSCLQGIGKMTLPVVNLFIGAATKIGITYVLVGIPSLNIKGAAIGTASAYLIAGFLNYMALRKYAKIKLDMLNVFVRPLLASLIMGASALAIYKGVFALLESNTMACGISILVAIFVYFVMVFVTGAIRREDLMFVPKGEYIYMLALKLRLVK